MKMERSWVAWMAALVMAAILMATPREGAAEKPGPYMMPEPPGPFLGEPDEPSAIQEKRGSWWLNFARSPAWIQIGSSRTKPALPAKRNAPVRGRTAKHE